MKKYAYSHNIGLLVLRLLLAALFIYHVVPKLGASADMVAFIGGVPIGMGLDFLSANVWFYLAVVGELFIIFTALFGLCTRLGSVILLVIMFFAMSAKKWGMPAIELDLVLAVIGIVLFIAGPGKYSLSRYHQFSCKDEK